MEGCILNVIWDWSELGTLCSLHLVPLQLIVYIEEGPLTGLKQLIGLSFAVCWVSSRDKMSMLTTLT